MAPSCPDRPAVVACRFSPRRAWGRPRERASSRVSAALRSGLRRGRELHVELGQSLALNSSNGGPKEADRSPGSGRHVQISRDHPFERIGARRPSARSFTLVSERSRSRACPGSRPLASGSPRTGRRRESTPRARDGLGRAVTLLQARQHAAGDECGNEHKALQGLLSELGTLASQVERRWQAGRSRRAITGSQD